MPTFLTGAEKRKLERLFEKGSRPAWPRIAPSQSWRPSASLSAEADFDALAKQVRAAIEKNEPQSWLDRLHTFVTKYVRSLCDVTVRVPREPVLATAARLRVSAMWPKSQH